MKKPLVVQWDFGIFFFIFDILMGKLNCVQKNNNNFE